MHIFQKILIAALALGTVAIGSAAAPASAATETTTMSIGLTITAPISGSARHDKWGSKAGAALKATTGATDSGSIAHSLKLPTIALPEIARGAGVKPELTTHRIASANSDTIVTTLSY